MPVGTKWHQGQQNRCGDNHEKSAFETTWHIFIFNTFPTETKGSTLPVWIRQHQHPAVYSFKNRIGDESKRKEHTQAVQVLEEIRSMLEGKIVYGTEVFTYKEKY
jgi:hypothetical protein